MEAKDMLIEVAKELNQIKANATQKELNKLDYESFSSRATDGCVYGQMTGHYQSARAKEIMAKTHDCLEDSFEEDDFAKGNSVTLLEKYISYCDYNDGNYISIEDILEYLKGERHSLTLVIHEAEYICNTSYASLSNVNQPNQVNQGVIIESVKEFKF